MPKRCAGVRIEGKCLPKKRLDTLYGEFADEMSVNPFIDQSTPRQHMDNFLRDKHPRLKPRKVWVKGLMHIYKTEVQ